MAHTIKSARKALEAFLEYESLENSPLASFLNDIIQEAERLDGIALEQRYYLNWIEREFRHSIGCGKSHDVVCEVHKGKPLYQAIDEVQARSVAEQ